MASLGDIPMRGKSVLLISPRTFGYERAITKALESNGASVRFIDERPANDLFTKGLIRINADLIRKRIERYYRRELDGIPGNARIDQVLLISPEAVNESVATAVKRRFPGAEMILYMWDALRNKTGTDNRRLLPYFDRVLSFDRGDCAEFPKMKFRPLFFLPEFEEIPRVHNPRYDVSFIGTIHSDRYVICARLKELAARKGLNAFFYMYIHDKRLYCYAKLTNPGMRGGRVSEFAFSPMPMPKVLEAIRDSRCLIDIQHPKQTGLTMRTIESLGARRKLITTNRSIREYDFYSETNISVIDRENVDFSAEFVLSDQKTVDRAVYGKYSIKGWMRDVFGLA
jgi:hypothetical protein